MRFSLMTKKLDDIHIAQVHGRTRSLCGKFFPGNDYYMDEQFKLIDQELRNKPRKACLRCMQIANEMLNIYEEHTGSPHSIKTLLEGQK